MFDKVIMNPAYKGSLHLKILETVIKNCLKAEVVNLSPDDYKYCLPKYVEWSKDANIEFIAGCEVEFKHIEHREANDLFGLSNGIQGGLRIGLYKYNDSPKEIWPKVFIKLNKLFRKDNLRKHFVRMEDNTELGQRVFRYHSGGETWVENVLCDQGRAVEGIMFGSKEEKENFRNSIGLWPYKLADKLNALNPAHLPFLGDYTHPWTDKDLYDKFGLTDEEIAIIEKELTN